MTVAQALLVRQEGRALHEEGRERRHADIRHGIGLVRPVTFVGERFAGLAQVAEQGFKAVHTETESYLRPVPEPPIGGVPRIFAQVCLLRLSSCLGLTPVATRFRIENCCSRASNSKCALATFPE